VFLEKKKLIKKKKKIDLTKQTKDFLAITNGQKLGNSR
jgi:hypothetical protein